MCMQGNMEGWVLKLLEQYEEGDWLEWLDHTEGTGDDAVDHMRLKTIIK